MCKVEPGQEVVFTKKVEGVCTINEGDTAIYLGNNQVRMLTGPSVDWLLTLSVDAPIKAVEK